MSEALTNKIAAANTVLTSLALAVDITCLVLITGGSLYKLARQKTTPFIWMQIGLLWLAYVCFTIRDVTFMTDLGTKIIADGQAPYFVQAAVYLGAGFYFLQHWIFALSYFRIAVVFKLCFSFKCEKARRELARRLRLIRIAGAMLMAALLLSWLLVIVLSPSYG